jgi:hypothetical protein
MNMEKNNKPEKHFKFGGIRASVWCDMRKGPGGQKENDIPKAVAALQKAYEFMTQKKGDGEEDAGE